MGESDDLRRIKLAQIGYEEAIIHIADVSFNEINRRDDRESFVSRRTSRGLILETSSKSSLSSPSVQHNSSSEFHQKYRTMGSIEIQKRAISQSLGLEDSFFRNNSSSLFVKEEIFSSKNDSTTNDDQNPIQVYSSNRPGAYLMNGARVASRATVGMITPFHQEEAMGYSCHEKSNEVQRILQKNNDFEMKSNDSVLFSKDGSKSADFMLKQIENKHKSNRSLLPESTVRRCNKKWVVVAIVLTVIITAIILVAVLVRKIHSRKRQQPSSENNNLALTWKDVFNQCQQNGTINLTSIESDITLFKIYQSLQQEVDTEKVETCSPQQLSLWSMALAQHKNNNLESFNNETQSSSTTMTRHILSVLFFSLGGPNWRNSHQWISHANYCEWIFVECIEGEVNELNLASVRLVGTLPDELYLLTSLALLDLDRNEISGTLSDAIGNLSNLAALFLVENPISGPLPSALFSLTNLTSLGLPHGEAARGFSVSNLALLPKLAELIFHSDHFSGNDEAIPTEMGLLTNLEVLSIDGSPRGTIPSELVLLPRMEHFRINAGTGSLTGTLPSEMFDPKTNWRTLFLGRNELSGTIPTFIGMQTILQEFYLDENRLSGTIPTEIANCSSLETLDLQLNPLTGTIPTEIASLRNLKVLRLPTCPGLQGTVPPLLCSNIPGLQVQVTSDDGCLRSVENLLVQSCADLECCTFF